MASAVGLIFCRILVIDGKLQKIAYPQIIIDLIIICANVCYNNSVSSSIIVGLHIEAVRLRQKNKQ